MGLTIKLFVVLCSLVIVEYIAQPAQVSCATTSTIKPDALGPTTVSQAKLDLDAQEWQAYKEKFGKSYGELEDSRRKEIYLETRKLVEDFNKEHAEKRGYHLGINHMADWTPEERDRLFGTRIPSVPGKVDLDG